MAAAVKTQLGMNAGRRPALERVQNIYGPRPYGWYPALVLKYLLGKKG